MENENAGFGCGCLVIIIIIILIFNGCSDSSTATSPPIVEPSPVERVISKTPIVERFDTMPISSTNVNWNLDIINWNDIGKNLCWSNDNNCEIASGKWRLIKIKLTNSSNFNASLSSANFRLNDEKDEKYSHYKNLSLTKLYANYISETPIDNSIVRSGLAEEFILLYDIPETIDTLNLEFMPNFREKSEVFVLDKSNQLAQSSIEQKQWKLEILKVEKKGKELEWSNYENKEIASGYWLIVVTNFTNLTYKPMAINTANFRIISKNKDIYEHYQNLAIAENYGVYRKGQAILNSIIKPSEQSKYYLVYDLPSGVEAEYLQFIPNLNERGTLFDLNS